MRALGLHRGNPTVRIAVHQALRRRLYAELTPHASAAGDEPLADAVSQPWSRAFFEQARADALPRMARLGPLDDGELRYFGARDLSLWALASEHALVFAQDFRDTREQLHERARRWIACLRTRTAPGLASRHWGHPVYGARLDPRTGELDVVWAVPGDWVSFVQSPGAWARAADQPEHWSAAVAVG
jgi:hypothetical protein